MKLESNGILIAMRPMRERDSLAYVFTSEFGVLSGSMRAAQIMKKNRPLVGQIGAVAWNARLDSQLGTFHWDAARNLAAPLIADAEKLNFMNSAFSLISALLPERESFPTLYTDTVNLLIGLASGAGRDADLYLAWETALLRELGYALNLTACSGCGGRRNLNYLSPRTGRAVCDDCAAPYIGRLYELPLTLNITLKFLNSVCDGLGVVLPPARAWLCGQKN